MALLRPTQARETPSGPAHGSEAIVNCTHFFMKLGSRRRLYGDSSGRFRLPGFIKGCVQNITLFELVNTTVVCLGRLKTTHIEAPESNNPVLDSTTPTTTAGSSQEQRTRSRRPVPWPAYFSICTLGATTSLREKSYGGRRNSRRLVEKPACIPRETTHERAQSLETAGPGRVGLPITGVNQSAQKMHSKGVLWPERGTSKRP